jgi:hypothetical protein
MASLFCFYSLVSCSENESVLAKVDTVELTENDAQILMTHLGYNAQNKEEYNKFIEEWCENEAFKNELKLEYPESWNLIKLRSELFSGELAKYHIEEIELKKLLDTFVSQAEIEKYYNSQKDEFILHDYIVKALYLKIPKNLDFKSKNVHLSYMLKNDKDLLEVNSYAKLYAEDYYFNDSTWEYFQVLTKDIPLAKYNIDNIVLNRTKTYFSDDNFTYFLNVIDFKLKDEAPPIDFLQKEIKEIIIASRLQDLKTKNENKLIQRIISKHEIIINN